MWKTTALAAGGGEDGKQKLKIKLKKMKEI